jgi:hypothetical protein
VWAVMGPQPHALFLFAGGAAMDSDGHIGFNEASRRFGVSLEVLRRRVQRGELTLYRDPLDDRRKLLKVRDLEAMRRPRLAKAKELTASAAA